MSLLFCGTFDMSNYDCGEVFGLSEFCVYVLLCIEQPPEGVEWHVGWLAPETKWND